MQFSTECILCLINKMHSLYSGFDNNEKNRLDFLKEVLGIIQSANEDTSAPYLYSVLMQVLNRRLNIHDVYLEEKKKYNRILMDMEQYIHEKILSAKDPLLTALKYAMAGNRIDFGVNEPLNPSALFEILDKTEQQQVRLNTYQLFLKDLQHAKKLLYITDNAGEIVLDKLFIQMIRRNYPNIRIYALVRGAPVLNDATLEDARETGLCEAAEVCGNGTAIPGTCIESINDAAKFLIEDADIIISKGQGNFESLMDQGLNIYYIFLCKCARFINRFKLNKFDGVFMHEKEYENIVNE